MKKKKWAYFALAVITAVLLIKLLLWAFLDPWITGKIQSKLGENNKYLISVKKVHIHLLSSVIQLDSISVFSKSTNDKTLNINGQIEAVKIKGINIPRLVFSKKVSIKSISLKNSFFTGLIPVNKEDIQSIIIPFDITADMLLCENTNLSFAYFSNSASYSVKEGVLKVYNLHLFKNDTLSKKTIPGADFKARELITVTTDSMYSFRLCSIEYRSVSNVLTSDSFFIHPNYKDYNFTSRYKFQKDRIEAAISEIKIKDFKAEEYLRSGSLLSSYIEVGNMNLNVFRDKRKEFRHVERPVFQEIIASYASLIRIDTITILHGIITYRDHAEKAEDQGQITFDKISSDIYNISNDTVIMNRNSFLELRCNALLMGKSNLSIDLKSKLFDDLNSFSVNGRLSEIEINDMNPYLENSTLIIATSGRIESIDFNFTANDIESKGSMIMLYNGLNISVKNKNTHETTALRERIISSFVNRIVLDSNPLKGEELRIGIIGYERDPEKFLFSYFAQSFLSGMKSSLLKSSKSK